MFAFSISWRSCLYQKHVFQQKFSLIRSSYNYIFCRCFLQIKQTILIILDNIISFLLLRVLLVNLHLINVITQVLFVFKTINAFKFIPMIRLILYNKYVLYLIKIHINNYVVVVVLMSQHFLLNMCVYRTTNILSWLCFIALPYLHRLMSVCSSPIYVIYGYMYFVYLTTVGLFLNKN